jgi:N-acetylglucosamine-6-sulfatase
MQRLSVGLLIAALFGAGTASPAQDAPRPNIVYVMSDDHALRTIGAYGSGLHPTPNIDRLAEEGAVFTRAFVGNSICGPSRAAILTGTHGHVNGVTGNGEPWDSTQAVFPRLLQGAGYQTALFGKWHLNSRPADEFDTYTILTGAGKQGFYYNPEVYSPEAGTQTWRGYSTDLVTDRALRWLEEEREAERPFLLLVQYKAPHVPRMPPLRLLERYLDVTVPEPPTLYDDMTTRTENARRVNFFLDTFRPLPRYGTYAPREESIYLARMTDDERRAYHAVVDPQNEDYWRMRANGLLDTPEAMRAYVYQRFIKDYLRLVDALDENVGRLLDRIDADPALRENTVVVYASDQGYFTGEHGYAEKRLMYEEAMRMPLLMRWPGHVAPGSRIDALVQNIDLAPTFLAMAGVPVPDRMQGVPLLPLFDGDAPSSWRRSVYYHYYDHMRHRVARHAGVRGERYKLVHFYTDDTWEFYDLDADPLEVRNVYGDPAYQDEVEAMRAEYLRLRRQYGVPPEHFVPPFG